MAEGCIFAIYMNRQRSEELANAVTDQESAIKPITMQQAHDRLGHMSEQATKATTRALKIPIKNGAFKLCAACAAGKAKQKCIKQIVTTKQKLGQCQAFLDIATVRKKKRYAYTITSELENISGGSRDPNKILKILST